MIANVTILGSTWYDMLAPKNFLKHFRGTFLILL